MALFGRWVKIWAFISLNSMLLWAYHFFPFGYEKFSIVVIQGKYDSYVSNLGLAFWTSFIGIHTLLLAALLGLIGLALSSAKPSSKWTTGIVAGAIVSYASYFALEILFVPILMPLTTFFAYSYAVQAVFTVPFMIILAFKVWNYDGDPNMWKWAGIAFAGFVVALWANVTMRWFDMISTLGITFLLTGIISLGFLDSAILMSLAVAFSIVAAYLIRHKRLNALKWVGLSLTAVGLHYIVYIVYTVYSYYANVLSFVLLVDVWTIPFLGLGLTMLLQGDTEKPYGVGAQ